jgi:hypothetical protein
MIVAIAMYFVDQNFAFGFYTDKIIAMVSHMAHSFGV